MKRRSSAPCSPSQHEQARSTAAYRCRALMDRCRSAPSLVAVRRGSMLTTRTPRSARADLDALVEDRVAPGRIGADQHHEIGKLQVVVALRHHVGAEGAAVAGDRGGHAQARVGVDVRRADEALGQLVGDVIVLGQQLAREIEGDRLGAVRGADGARGGRRRDRAPRPSSRAGRRSSGCSSRVSSPSVSPSAEPLEHSRPKLAGCSRIAARWRRRPCRRAWRARRSRRRSRGRWCGRPSFPLPTLPWGEG